MVRLRKAYNDALRWSGFVLAEDPLFIPISWSDGTCFISAATPNLIAAT